MNHRVIGSLVIVGLMAALLALYLTIMGVFDNEPEFIVAEVPADIQEPPQVIEPTVTIYMHGKMPLVVTVDDVKQMSPDELQRYSILLTIAQAYGHGEGRQFIDRLFCEYLPLWILERLKNVEK